MLWWPEVIASNHAYHEEDRRWDTAAKWPLSGGGARSFPARRLIAHFLDHYVLACNGLGSGNSAVDRAIIAEAGSAFRISILASDEVLVPSISYAQSAVCKAVVDRYSDYFALGAVRLLTDADTLEEFRDNRLREYPAGSPLFEVYRDFGRDQSIVPPLTSTNCNFTSMLHGEWTTKQSLPLLAGRLKAPSEALHRNSEQLALSDVLERLGQSAFLAENLYAFFFRTQDTIVFDRLRKIICDDLFGVLAATTGIVPRHVV